MLGERADTEIDAREVQSFARTQLTAESDDAFDVVAHNTLDHELHKAIVQINPIAWLHYARQRLETHRDALRIADNVFICKREMRARRELNRF